MQLEELRDRTYRDLAEANIGNDRVQATHINKALNDAYRTIAAKTGCFKRTAYLEAVDDRNEYSLPVDMFRAIAVRYNTGTVPLEKVPLKTLDVRSPGWRDTTPGTPTTLYLPDARKKIGLHPAPNLTSNALVNIGTIVRSTGVVTVTCPGGHGLLAGEIVKVAGTTNYNGIYKVATIVAGAPSTVFTYLQPDEDNAGSEAAGTTLEIFPIKVHGCILPVTSTNRTAYNLIDAVTALESDADEPELPDHFHELLIHDAVSRLASRYLLDSEVAGVKAAAAKADFDAMLPDLIDNDATGMNVAATAGVSSTRR